MDMDEQSDGLDTESEIAEKILSSWEESRNMVPHRNDALGKKDKEHHKFITEEAEFSHLIEMQGEDYVVTYEASPAEFARLANRDSEDLIAVLSEPQAVVEDGVEKRIRYTVRTMKAEYAHTVARLVHEVCGHESR